MDALLVVASGVLGLLIGSFLNVVIWRVPRGESVVRPPSACPACGQAIRSFDNVPVLSWLLLRGRCRDCAEPISARYPLVEGLTGALFALTAWHFGFDAALPAYLYFVAVGVALALIDFDVHRLPDALTLPSYGVGLVLLGGAAAVDGEWHALLRAVICAAIAFGFYFAVWFAYPAGMGFGDVKLAGVVGLYLGWLSYGILATGLFLGFFLGAVISVGLVAFAGAGRKTRVPFGPFMLVGAYLAFLVGQRLVDAYVSVTVA
ncbi:MAG: Prepilin peptidase [Frankiales bacterium]|nr:Prepilin peptidase [Frankiales bacterium]